MKQGQTVTHKRYGQCKVVKVIKEDPKVKSSKPGLLLKILDKKSFQKFNDDREMLYAKGSQTGNLKYCFEDSKHMIVNPEKSKKTKNGKQ